MKKALRLTSLIFCLLIFNSCSSSECNVFDYPADSQPKLDALKQKKYAIQDLKKGQGRYAQLGRRMQIRVKVRNSQKRTIAQGVMTYEYPMAKNYYTGQADLHGFPYPGNFPIGMAKAIIGMQEGGVRRFTLEDWRFVQGNAGNAAFRKKATRYLVSSDNTKQLMKSDEKGKMHFEVTLKKVCRPIYCLKTSYSVPAMRNQKIVERDCK